MDPQTSSRLFIVIIALLIDGALGDPPNRFHLVAWMGSAIAAARRKAPRPGMGRDVWRGKLMPLAYGGLVGLGGPLGV